MSGGVERAAKRAMIGWLGPLFPARRPPARATGMAPGERYRVLLVRVDDRLGNLILLSPAIDWLRRTSPKLEIDLLCSGAFASIYAADPRIDRLRILDKGRQKSFFPVFLADLAAVARAGYDAAIDCSDREAFSFSSALYTRATRAPRRIGFANDLADRYLSETVAPPADPADPTDPAHAAHPAHLAHLAPSPHKARDPLLLAAALLGAAAPPLEECRLALRLPEPDRAWSARLDAMADGAAGDAIVGLHVGGRGPKRWPLSRWTDLAAGLLDAGLRPWVFHGPMEEDVEPAFAPLRARGLEIVPRAGVVEVGQALSRCRVVVAPDTGPMHLASAVGTPTLALFLSSDPERYRPLGPEDRVIDARGRDLEAGAVLEQAAAMAAMAAMASAVRPAVRPAEGRR